MKPVTLRTARLVLDQPTLEDVDLITHYCQEEAFGGLSMATPWPYEREHAIGFVSQFVPNSWEVDNEYTWALRLDGTLIGMTGYRTTGHDIGYWVGAEYRGNGYMPEAVASMLDWIFGTGVDEVLWETVVGNNASLSVARATGFTFTGEHPSRFTARDDSHPRAWQGKLSRSDSREPKPGWPV